MEDGKYAMKGLGDILLFRMEDNEHGGLPFFIRRYSPAVQSSPLHMHDFMQVNYVYRGKGRHFVNNHWFDIIKGDIFVIPPGVPHYILASNDPDVELIEFEFVPGFINQNFENIENMESFLDFAYIEPFLVSENNIKPRLNLCGGMQVEVEDLLFEALKEYENRAPGFVLLVKSLLLKLLVIAGREFTKELNREESQSMFGLHKDAICNAMQHIANHYSEDLTIESVARKYALSQSYFSYLFKNITSKTFTEYLNGIRIAKAMELLSTTNGRVLDICLETGFRNVNHFNRLFKQKIGVSPSAYRKTFKQVAKVKN